MTEGFKALSKNTIRVPCSLILQAAQSIVQMYDRWEASERDALIAADADYRKRLDVARLEIFNTEKRRVFFFFHIRKYRSIDDIRQWRTGVYMTSDHVRLDKRSKEINTARRDAEYCLKTFPETGTAEIDVESAARRVLKAFETLNGPENVNA